MQKRKKAKEKFWYMALLLPGFALFIFSIVIPFISGIQVSFTSWDGIGQVMKYVGVKNYLLLLKSPDFWNSVGHSFYFAILITVSNNVLSLAVALGLNRAFKGRGALRTAFFFPTCLSTVLAAFIWSFLFRESLAPLFGGMSLLGNYKTVIPGIVLIALWNGLGINVVIYLAGLSNISRELYEAARVDGANALQSFKSVTVPMLMPSITVCVTMTLIGGLKEFATTMAATGGGPGKASEMVSIHIYKNLYSYYQAGYGQAVAIVFVLILIVCGGILSKVLRSREVEA
ncbi:sugar ABC transporter permease [Faecalicatena contorta]|jgi:raffinose/stachyose/melibiose transport system permease protein|uniref:carbohydrate ABC transporter permease n=1 Tax=Faecalicatena contorta TaxID=39482 RepID=UPI0031CFFD79